MAQQSHEAVADELTTEPNTPLTHRTASPGIQPKPVAATFYRDVVNSLRNGVVVVTSDGDLAHINREACRVLGVRAGADAIGRPFGEVLQSCPEVVRILLSAFELSNPPSRAEIKLGRTNRVIGYTVCPIRDAGGRLTGAALLFKDLTRLEQLEERERLRDRLAALGEMAATIAHEVKNPLAGIKVMAGLLKRRVHGVSDAEALLNDIINEANMADAIVLEILEFVRPLRLEVERVALPRLLHDAVRIAENQHGNAGTTIVVSADDALPLIEVDSTQLRQLLTNLVTNALEALGGSGTVRVVARPKPLDSELEAVEHAAAPPAMVEIVVQDDGPGIPEDLRDRIFSPFFTTKPKGSGLGLAIVRKIVDAHEGRIDLTVDPQGTCFRVTLPVAVAREIASPFGTRWTGTGN